MLSPEIISWQHGAAFDVRARESVARLIVHLNKWYSEIVDYSQ